MATLTQYTFNQTYDIPSLTTQIQASSIVTVLDHIEVTGSITDVWFKDVLSSADQTTLNTVITNYVYIAPPANPPQAVTLSTIPAAPAFATNAFGTKNLYMAMTGIQQALTVGSNTITFVIPYAEVEINGVSVIGSEALDVVSFSVLDSTTGTYSGHANAVLNQFGYNVNLPAGQYEYECAYTSTLYQNMQIQLVYTSISAKTIGINFILNQVK
jgi:hypothetical protein